MLVLDGKEYYFEDITDMDNIALLDLIDFVNTHAILDMEERSILQVFKTRVQNRIYQSYIGKE